MVGAWDKLQEHTVLWKHSYAYTKNSYVPVCIIAYDIREFIHLIYFVIACNLLFRVLVETAAH